MTSKLSDQQKAEIRVLAKRGTRRLALAAEYGVSVTTIYKALGRPGNGRRGRPPRPLGPCVICGTTAASGRVLRFGLLRSIGNGRTSRGAGSIELCETCWRTHASRHRRPRGMAA